MYLTSNMSKVLKRAFENTNYLMMRIACTWRGAAPKLWRAEISKRLWIGRFQFACVHYTYRCASDINLSQIWEVTWTNYQDFGWFDMEWPIIIKIIFSFFLNTDQHFLQEVKRSGVCAVCSLLVLLCVQIGINCLLKGILPDVE